MGRGGREKFPPFLRGEGTSFNDSLLVWGSVCVFHFWHTVPQALKADLETDLDAFLGFLHPFLSSCSLESLLGGSLDGGGVGLRWGSHFEGFGGFSPH